MPHVQHRQSDSDAAFVANCLARHGASGELIVRTLNYLHEWVSYTLVKSPRIDDMSFAIHRLPDDDSNYRPSIEIWNSRKKP